MLDNVQTFQNYLSGQCNNQTEQQKIISVWGSNEKRALALLQTI